MTLCPDPLLRDPPVANVAPAASDHRDAIASPPIFALIMRLTTSIVAAIFCIVLCECSEQDDYFPFLNKCGCYRPKNCPSNAQCTADILSLEEFYKYASGPHETPEKCNKCFLEGYEKNLTDYKNGTLKVALQFSPDSIDEAFDNLYESQLLYVDEENLTATHSKVYLQITDKPCAEFLFQNVFSGNYQLFIKRNGNSCCISETFTLSSSYRKEFIKKDKESSIQGQSLDKIVEPTPWVGHEMTSASQSRVSRDQDALEASCIVRSRMFNYYGTSKTRKDLECTFSDNRMNQVNSIHVRVTNASGDQCVMETHLTHVSRGNCCDARGGLNYCPCYWYDNSSLICTVRDVKFGNYTIQVEYVDPRCERGTLWMKINDSCVWHLTQVVFKEEHELDTTAELPKTSLRLSLVSFIIIVSVSILLSIVLYHLKCHFFMTNWQAKNRNRHLPKNDPEIITALHNPTKEDKIEVLLLYPRDCEIFMEAMELFRTVLKDSLLGKVYDPWDEDIFDEVVMSLDTWSLPLITNDNVKIVILLSQCSKIVEETYVHEKCNFKYKNHNLLDGIFGQSLKAVYQHFSTRSDSYQRVFIVRLDETSDMKLSFHMNCATIYTIPQGLLTLLMDLAKEYPPRIREDYRFRLETLIREYKNFKKLSDDYLNEILRII